MEPFKVTCVTCTARLAVRSESLVGQIVACPKCGSMVHVVRPEGGPTAPAADERSSGVTSSTATFALESVVPGAVPPGAPPAPPHAAATFDDVADSTSGEPVAANASAPPKTPTPPVPAPRRATWSTSKLAVLTGLSAVAGSALVAGLILLLRSDPESPAAIVTESPLVAQATPERAPIESPPVDVAEAPAPAPEETAAAPVVPDAATTPADDNPFAPPAETQPDEQTTAIATAPPIAPTDDPAAAKDPTETAAADARTPRLHIDPLEFDPEGLDLTTLMTSRPAADPLAAGQLDEGPAPAADSAVPPDHEDDDQPKAEPDPLRFEPVGPPSNVAELLKRHLPAVSIKEMPLCRFVDFATELSGLPVSVSPAELRLAAVSPGAAVSVDAKDATIEQLLADALKPLRLAPAVEGSRIELRRAAADRRRELNYPVDDLAANDAEVQRLATRVQQLVEPATWATHGGDGVLKIEGKSLHIEHDERVGFETILFLERYRVASGLPPRSKYPAALLTVGPAGAGIDERLAGPTTFTFAQPTALRTVFRWWQEELEAPVLIDWPALTDQRLWPKSRMTASAINQPWSTSLTASLTPLQLGWRAVDGRTLEITTLDKIRSEPQLALYRIAAGASVRPDKMLKQIEGLAQAGGAAGSDAGVFYDANHRVLIVRQPAPVQTHVSAWLREQGLFEAAAAK